MLNKSSGQARREHLFRASFTFLPALMSPAVPHSPSSIVERIARARLTRAQQRMAQYVLAHPFRVATMTIDEFALATGVSVASANRLARALDLPGYPQFRSMLARGFEAALAPVEKLRTGLAHSGNGESGAACPVRTRRR